MAIFWALAGAQPVPRPTRAPWPLYMDQQQMLAPTWPQLLFGLLSVTNYFSMFVECVSCPRTRCAPPAGPCTAGPSTTPAAALRIVPAGYTGLGLASRCSWLLL
jgi:hypothetical protein